MHVAMLVVAGGSTPASQAPAASSSGQMANPAGRAQVQAVPVVQQAVVQAVHPASHGLVVVVQVPAGRVHAQVVDPQHHRW